MNGEVFRSSLMQQILMMDESNPKSSQYLSQPSSVTVPLASLPCNKDLTAESWSQLFFGGVVGEEEKDEMSLLQPKDTDNWEDEQRAPLVSAPAAADHVVSGYFHGNGNGVEEEAGGIVSWRQILPRAAVMDFSNNMEDNKRHHPDAHECNKSSGEAHSKKTRVQVSSAQCAFKVRKEKLGDRITALHQLVSPFGKTDTASVLLEAIGYIRFLQSQIEALSTPYLGCGSRNRRQPAFLHEKKRRPRDDEEEMHKKDEQQKDLHSRGLCLVPVAFTFHVGNDKSAADFWAPAFISGGRGGLCFR